MIQLTEDLARELGCPVGVTYLPKTREVIVVAFAFPYPGRQVRVTLPVPPLTPPLSNNSLLPMKDNFLRALRRRINQDPEDG